MKSFSVTIQMTRLLSSTFLWCYLLCCTRWFQFLSLWMKSSSVTIEMKAVEQYFPAVLPMIVYKLACARTTVSKVIKQ